MTTVMEFLVGNAIALGAVGVVAALAAAIFALGGDDRAAPRPTRPIATAGDIAESDDAVAVVGTVDCVDALRTPFVDEPSVAYQIAVAGRLGQVATVGADTAFTLTVDGEPVRVRGGDSTPTPVVDDARHEHRRTGDSRDDFDATSLEELAAHDAARTRLSRLLAGTVSPDSAPRDYRVRYASTGDELAVVGSLRRDVDGWTLEPRGTESLRYLDPDTVVRDR